MDVKNKRVISPKIIETTFEDINIRLQPYITKDGNRRVQWKISQAMGRNAVVDPEESHLILPNEREIMINGIKRNYLKIPRWTADSLIREFLEIEQKENMTNESIKSQQTKKQPESDSKNKQEDSFIFKEINEGKETPQKGKEESKE